MDLRGDFPIPERLDATRAPYLKVAWCMHHRTHSSAERGGLICHREDNGEQGTKEVLSAARDIKGPLRDALARALINNQLLRSPDFLPILALLGH
ncbi:hypothetical protein NPIL_219071 [Nephila pilipes]|uniref:Uncharacterized protein n=1 Tax=Nephila pilipes TaxID=299642 RepID=A0A8X6UA25_NEPPI|nr:hypothetical protein NPIL_219071 [Nephila pilipes]